MNSSGNLGGRATLNSAFEIKAVPVCLWLFLNTSLINCKSANVTSCFASNEQLVIVRQMLHLVVVPLRLCLAERVLHRDIPWDVISWVNPAGCESLHLLPVGGCEWLGRRRSLCLWHHHAVVQFPDLRVQLLTELTASFL